MDRQRRQHRAPPSSRVGVRQLAPLLSALLVAACVRAPAPMPPPSASAAVLPTPVALVSPPSTTPSEDAGSVVLVGAGDIARCRSTADEATAAIVERTPGVVFTAGDDAYEDGSPEQFKDCYDPTWGAFKARTYPSVGNHDFKTPGGAGYFAYFGPIAGTPGNGWYAYDAGAWRVEVLNSNCEIVGCAYGSEQLAWLRADLAAHPTRCTLAIWHHPLFSSGFHGEDLTVRPLWDALAMAGADVIVNGHDHDYERFGPQTATGGADLAHGIREFVVGTGGAELRPFTTVKPNSEARSDTTHGVIVLTLHPTSYDWRFVPVAGETFTDSGSDTCH